MCVRVYNTDSRESTDNPREFAEMLGISVKELPVDNNCGQLIPDSCLCQVDIKKACDIAGYHYNENDDFEPVISKKTHSEVVKNITNHR
jgi:hypothetical protein